MMMRIYQKMNNNIPDMLPREYENTITLFDGISNHDLDAIIIYLQLVRAKRKRDFESNRMFGVCDNCIRVYPSTFNECANCEKGLRTLPIRMEYNYLLDGPPKDNNNHWVEKT